MRLDWPQRYNRFGFKSPSGRFVAHHDLKWLESHANSMLREKGEEISRLTAQLRECERRLGDGPGAVWAAHQAQLALEEIQLPLPLEESQL